MERPTGLTAVCVLAIVLGLFGVASTLSGIFGLAAPAIRSNPFPAGSQEQKMIQAQNQMQAELRALTNRFKIFHVPIIVSLFCVSVGLIWGGALSLQLKPKGPVILGPSLWL